VTRRRLMLKLSRATPFVLVGVVSLAVLCYTALAWSALAAGPRATKRAYGVVDLAEKKVTRALIALGDTVFHGTNGPGLCAVCHGEGGQGSKSGPRLAGVRLKVDNHVDSIARVIRRGIYWPPSMGIAMPPYDGVLDRDEIWAVAAYVQSISRR
jgi:mono/diheme cytochrome c family protein